MLFHSAADVDEVVGDDAEPDPAFHSVVALVAAANEAVPALGDADASLASGLPFLTLRNQRFFFSRSKRVRRNYLFPVREIKRIAVDCYGGIFLPFAFF